MNRFPLFQDIYQRYVETSDPPLKTQHDLLLPMAVYRLLIQRQLHRVLQDSPDPVAAMVVGGFNDSAEMIAVQSAVFNLGKGRDREFAGHVLSLSQQGIGIGAKHPILDNVQIHAFTQFFAGDGPATTTVNDKAPVAASPSSSTDENEWILKVEESDTSSSEESGSAVMDELPGSSSSTPESAVVDPIALLSTNRFWIFGQAFSYFLRKRHQQNRYSENSLNSFMLQFLRLLFQQIPEGCVCVFLDFPQDSGQSLPWKYVQNALIGTTLYQSTVERFSFDINQKNTVVLDAFVVTKPPALCLHARFYRMLDQWGNELRPRPRPYNEDSVPMIPRVLIQTNRESIELDLVSLERTFDHLGKLPGWKWAQNGGPSSDLLMKRWIHLKWLERHLSE